MSQDVPRYAGRFQSQVRKGDEDWTLDASDYHLFDELSGFVVADLPRSAHIRPYHPQAFEASWYD